MTLGCDRFTCFLVVLSRLALCTTPALSASAGRLRPPRQRSLITCFLALVLSTRLTPMDVIMASPFVVLLDNHTTNRNMAGSGMDIEQIGINIILAV